MPRVSKGTRTNAKHKGQIVPSKFKVGFLADLDHRRPLVKLLQQNYEDIIADAGGRDDVGRVKGALVERFVWLQAILQTLEYEMSQGKLDKLGVWIQATNALSGLAKVLGVDRKAKSMPWKVLENGNGNGNGNGKHAHGKHPKQLPNGFKELPQDNAAELEDK